MSSADTPPPPYEAAAAAATETTTGSSIEQRIQAASGRNRELLAVLSETDHALPDLQQQQRYVQDLDEQLGEKRALIGDLDRRRRQDLRDHERYRDSVLRRFAYKVGGRTDRFDERAAREEREYFDVLQREAREKELLRALEQLRAEAGAVLDGLGARRARRAAARRDLDRLYDAVFGGPSPGFPDEDAREQACRSAAQAYGTARQTAEGEAQAARILEAARRALRGALGSMESALGYSRRDIFGGGSFADMMERNALSAADRLVVEAQMLVRQARRLSPAVADLPPVRVDQGDLMMDIFFDNIFTDLAFHDKIKRSMVEVQRAARALEREIDNAQSRQQGMAQDLAQKGGHLADTRVALQQAREDAFRRVSG